MGLWNWLGKLWRPATDTPTRPEAKRGRWIPAEESPFGRITLDISEVVGGVISTTSDPEYADRSLSWATATAEVIPEPMGSTDVISCELRYPIAEAFPNGLLFAPTAMEEKWVLFHRDHSLVAVRSWTGEAVAVGRGRREGNIIIIEELAVKEGALGGFGDPVQTFDWLIRSHALGQRVPLPVTEEGLMALERVPLAVFGTFGNRAPCAVAAWDPPPVVYPMRVFGEAIQSLRGKESATRLAEILDEGADPDVPSPFQGYTALHVAMVQSNVSAMKLLLAHGANSRARTDRGMDALGIGIVNGATRATLEVLLAAGADPALANLDGFGLLHAAAESNRHELVPWLVERGLPLEARTARGLTPLHVACGLGHAESVRALLAAGADARAGSPLGTPVAIAESEGHQHIAKLLG